MQKKTQKNKTMEQTKETRTTQKNKTMEQTEETRTTQKFNARRNIFLTIRNN